jgi:Tol biopolymer transport system component
LQPTASRCALAAAEPGRWAFPKLFFGIKSICTVAVPSQPIFHQESTMNNRRYSKFLVRLVTVLMLLSLLVNPALASPGTTTRVSVASNGAQGNGDSFSSSISADGRYVAFHSIASNLVSGDTNGAWDVFVHDRQSGQTTRVSAASNGAQGNGDSESPSISADGRYVAFSSDASNLVSGDTNGAWDVFVHDRQSGQTTRVSAASNGAQGNGDSESPSISADGRYVAFSSDASNLVSGDTNGAWDVFVHDRQSG